MIRLLQPASNNAGSGDPAYKGSDVRPAGTVPSPGLPTPTVGRVPSHGVPLPTDAGLGDPAYRGGDVRPVGPVPSPGVCVRLNDAGSGDPAYNEALPPSEPPPRRLRRLHRVWPDRDGNISYLLTMCVDGRVRVLDNEETFQRLVDFLLGSPTRYHWFGRRFVVMPDHIHLIARMGNDAIRLGQWIKALKAFVGGLKPVGPVPSPGVPIPIVGRVPSHGVPMPPTDAGSGDPAYRGGDVQPVGPVPPPGVPIPIVGDVRPVGPVPSPGVPRLADAVTHPFTRVARAWWWQDGHHDHKFHTPESETRKWEYVCLNPVRYGLVQRPEEWPFGGEIFYDEAAGPRLVRGTPPLLETGLLIEEKETPGGDTRTKR